MQIHGTCTSRILLLPIPLSKFIAPSYYAKIKAIGFYPNITSTDSLDIGNYHIRQYYNVANFH